MSKQGERRARYPRKHKAPSVKTGPLKEVLIFKEQVNAIQGDTAAFAFIPKIK